jgi:hypothetical protein
MIHGRWTAVGRSRREEEGERERSDKNRNNMHVMTITTTNITHGPRSGLAWTVGVFFRSQH